MTINYDLHAILPNIETEDLLDCLGQYYESQELNDMDEMSFENQKIAEAYFNKILMEDYARVGHVKRLIGRYINKKEFRHDLLVNHIICLVNVFKSDLAVELLFMKIRRKDALPTLKTVLDFLDIIDPNQMFVGSKLGVAVDISKIPTDYNILAILNDEQDGRNVSRVERN